MGEYTTEEINKRYALLSHPDRRVIIQFLKDTDEGAIPIQDLVIHCWGSDTSQTNPNRISTALRHNHLPKLASANILEFDSAANTVRYCDDELAESLLAPISD